MPMPALLISTSSPPRRSIASATARVDRRLVAHVAGDHVVARRRRGRARRRARRARAARAAAAAPMPPARAGDQHARAHAVTGSPDRRRWRQLVVGRVEAPPRGGGSATSSRATASRCGRCRRGTSSRSRCSRPCPRMPALELGVEALLRPRARTSTVVGAVRAHVPQRVQHVGDLRLDHVDHRAVPEPGVRAEQQEQVREAGDRRAEVRARAALPDVVEQLAAAAADPVRRPACR